MTKSGFKSRRSSLGGCVIAMSSNTRSNGAPVPPDGSSRVLGVATHRNCCFLQQQPLSVLSTVNPMVAGVAEQHKVAGFCAERSKGESNPMVNVHFNAALRLQATPLACCLVALPDLRNCAPPLW